MQNQCIVNESQVDLNFRPESYWCTNQYSSHIGSRIKGELRRLTSKEMVQDGCIDPVILQESLPDEQLLHVGAVHPWLMRGRVPARLTSLGGGNSQSNTEINYARCHFAKS